MEGKLIFCSDAILRFQSDYDETSAFPLLSIQNAIADADPFFLLRFFHHMTLIEEGTTLASIFLAIEPWKALLVAYLDRDVGAYIDEVENRPGQRHGILNGLELTVEARFIVLTSVRIWKKGKIFRPILIASGSRLMSLT